MEIRAIITILFFSLLSIIFTYHIRLPYLSLPHIIEGAQKGLMIMIILSILLRKISFFSRHFNIFSQNESFVKSVLSCWLIGLYLGGFYGLTDSMIQNAWELPTLKFWILTSHCLTCFGTAAVIILSDCTYVARDMFTMVFNSPDTKISIKELLLSIVCSLIIADYITTIGMIYIGFFLNMYYYVYLIIISYPYLAGAGLGGCMIINFLVNIYRFFYLKPKLLEKRAEEEFRSTFP